MWHPELTGGKIHGFCGTNTIVSQVKDRKVGQEQEIRKYD